jgi:2'-5' RNA ligase
MLRKWGLFLNRNDEVMELTGITLPGYRIYEYLLVLRPPEELWSRIMKVKDEFATTYQAEHARWSKPYIAIANFQQYEMMEERINNRLQLIGMAQTPFRVELKEYGSFPSHTIFVNVSSRLPVQQLVKEIRSQAQRLIKLNDDHKPHFMLEPHITIARQLKPWQYEKGWLEYSHKSFTGRFIADAMFLLRRAAGEKKYQFVKKFSFQNMPVTTRQGELFG